MVDAKREGATKQGDSSQRQQRPFSPATDSVLREKMSKIRHKIIVLSGKGGVGKSTVAVNLAISLAKVGRRVGLLDTDIHGPSIPKLLDLEALPMVATENAILPIKYKRAIPGHAPIEFLVMSMGFLLKEHDAVIWRGPLKGSVIGQFLKDVQWGTLDYLVIDSPPGTGDEPLSLCQLIENPDGAVIVTTPQSIAVIDVKKAIRFCNVVRLPVLGVIENMSGFACPKCGEVTEIFRSGGGEKMAREMDVKFLGAIPIDPLIVQSGDSGDPSIITHPESKSTQAFEEIIGKLIRVVEEST
jgi:ATP-binding protein involved in chromosome partitioning